MTAASLALIVAASGCGSGNAMPGESSGAGGSVSQTGSGGAGGRAEVTCSSDRECLPSGLLCDTALAVCVDCLDDADCNAGSVCSKGRCRTQSEGSGGTTGAAASTGSAPSQGGTPSSSSGGTPSTGGSVATGDTCSNAASNVVDNFATCDVNICDLGGRHGTWYYFASLNVNQFFAASRPSSAWADQSCAAWSTGGPVSGVTVSSSYAGIGLQLAAGSPYNLQARSGVTVWMESGQTVTFVVKTLDGGYFGAAMSGASGNTARNIGFSSLKPMANSAVSTLDLTQVVAFEFDAADPVSYGFAIHSVSLN